MKIRFLSLAMVLVSMPVWGQNDEAAFAQHLILGQQVSGVAQLRSLTNTHPDAQWFPRADFGLFIHLGMSAMHGGIDLSWGMLKNKSWEDGEISPVEYWKLADRWNPVNFKPEEWAKQVKEAGFRYVVFTTKHHDGYTLWPSKYSDFGVEQKMGGRDLVKKVVEACRKNKLKIGLYFSPPDWYFDRKYRSFGNANGKYYDIYHKLVDKLPDKPVGHDEARRTMVINQVRELLTDYGKIDIMWFDGGHGEISNDEIRHLQPGIIVSRRNGELGDFGDSEGALPTKRFTGWFECNDPCWPSRWWSYSTSDRMDTGSEVIEKLVIMRAWGGNFLANVGPCGDGSMPKEALEAWREIGKWMKYSGESVYDITGGKFPEKANQPVTLKGDSLMYVHAFPNFYKRFIVQEMMKRPVRVVLLRTGEEVQFEYKGNVLAIHIPPHKRTRQVDVVKVYLE